MTTDQTGDNMITIQIGKGVRYRNVPLEVREKIFDDLTMENPKYKEAMKHGRWIGPDTPSHLYFFAVSSDKKIIWTPRGYLWYIKKWLNQEGYKIKIDDRTLRLPYLNIGFNGVLRDYQELAVDKMVTRYPQGILEAATGAGKTVMGCGIIARRKQPTLIIVHNKELLYQWQSSIKKFLNYDCGLIGDSKFDVRDISVGIINTVRNRTDQLVNKFGQIIIDECFPSGTLIDGKPIENIKIGDYVNSFNHKTGKIEKKRVLCLFKKKPETLCTIKLKNGQEITCTENHPFYTNKGYLTASQLNDTTMLCINVSFNEGECNENSICQLCELRENCSVSEWGISLSKFEGCKKKCSILFSEVQEKLSQQNKFGEDEKEQSNVQEGKYCTNEICETCKWNSECVDWNKRREWEIHTTTRKTCTCTWVGNGSSYKNSESQTKKPKKNLVQKEKCSYILQSRCGKQGFKNSNRNRWERNSCRTEKEIRQKERISFKMERVESVTIHKRTNRQGFGELCKDGYVYNIEIEDNHNYFAEGILVHNCHRCPSTTWTETLIQFPARFYLGLSATPFRRDGLGKALNLYIGHKIHKVDKKVLHSTGAVLKPNICIVRTNFRYMYRDDYSKMISALCKDNERNELISRIVCKDFEQYKQNVLIVSDRVSHCREIANKLKNRGMDSRVLSGNVSPAKRIKIVEDVKAGRVNVLIATLSLVGEGFDAPNLCALFITTPVKFSGRLIQVVGRVLRPEKGKIPRVYDFRDDNVSVLLNQGRSRNRIYTKEWGK